MQDKNKGAVLALTVAGLLAMTGCAHTGGAYSGIGSQVRCLGLNSCRGQSNCALGPHSCKGQNQCRGTGWSFATQQSCITHGGDPID